MTSEQPLQSLFDPETPLTASNLLSFSAMSEEEAAHFRTRWEGGPEGRRRELIDLFATIAEDNPEADFETVFRIALDDTQPDIRIHAIEGLWECRERWFLNRLVALAEQDEYVPVRAAATSALEKFVMLGVFEELRASLAQRVEEALKRIIDNQQEPVEVRRKAIEALSPSLDASVNDIIRDAYYSSTPELKLSALYAMGQHCDDGWLPVLLTELKNRDPAVRFEAARACGELGDDRAVPALEELTKEVDSQVQEAAIEALGRIGGDQARRALRRCLNQGDARVREAARAALEELTFGEDPLAFP